MSALRELQAGFVDAVLGTGVIGELDQRRLPAEVATAIYRNNVRGNALNALRADFPALCELLGEECFEGLSLRYLAAHPSRSGDLHGLGAHMPEFLKTVPEFSAWPYLPDVAQLEWLQRLALVAADVEAFDFEGLAGVPEADFGRLRFRPAPASHGLGSPWPIYGIWRLARSEAAGERAEDAGIDLERGGERVLVYRSGAGAVLTEPMSAGALALLQSLVEGRAFADACERAWAEEDGLDVGECLRAWVGKGVIGGWRR